MMIDEKCRKEIRIIIRIIKIIRTYQKIRSKVSFKFFLLVLLLYVVFSKWFFSVIKFPLNVHETTFR